MTVLPLWTVARVTTFVLSSLRTYQNFTSCYLQHVQVFHLKLKILFFANLIQIPPIPFTALDTPILSTIHHSHLTVYPTLWILTWNRFWPYLPINFVLTEPLWISLFPRLHFLGTVEILRLLRLQTVVSLTNCMWIWTPGSGAKAFIVQHHVVFEVAFYLSGGFAHLKFLT